MHRWNFPDISGGIETESLTRLSADHRWRWCWNFPDISGGIETLRDRQLHS